MKTFSRKNNNNVSAEHEEASHSQAEDVKQDVISTYTGVKGPGYNCFLLAQPGK